MMVLFICGVSSIRVMKIVSLLVFTVGCKSSTIAQFRSLGSRHHIVCYSGGKVILDANSPGNVSNQEHSDGYYFEDETTGKLVEVSGQCVITQI